VGRAARASAVGAFFALVIVGILVGGDRRDFTPTSFGRIPAGHGALYDLLRELGLPVARSFAAPEALPPDRTVWFIEPDEGCAARSLSGESLAPWLASGGHAVVLLPARLAACPPDAKVAGFALPGREEAAPGGVEPAPGAPAAPEATRLTVEGDWLRAPRSLELAAPVRFLPETAWSEEQGGAGEDGSWRIAATEAGRPFALERAVGGGRLLVIADGRFLENQWLDRADAAPLAVDLALALGAPWIDERAHGLVPSRGALAYLLRSPALPCFAGMALLALTFAWFGAAEPPRRVAEVDPSAPSLESYVQSLAGFYAATGDHARVLARYRELTARRLRRHFGLPPDAPLASLVDRLRRRPGLSRAGVAQLASRTPASNASELARAVALLDRLVEEAAR
jgi:Domain of unknown function (DUF4350)